MTPNIANQIITTLNAQIDELAAQVGTLQYEVDAIPAIKEERDALALEVDQWRVDYHELRLEHDALAEDAARYRWLRSSRHNDATVMTYVDGLDGWVAWADGEDVDTSVDKAMSQPGVQ